MTIPDVIGQEIEQAQALLTKGSFLVEVVCTNPPWMGEGKGKRRVVRQQYLGEQKIELVVAYDIYLKK